MSDDTRDVKTTGEMGQYVFCKVRILRKSNRIAGFASVLRAESAKLRRSLFYFFVAPSINSKLISCLLEFV